MAEIDRLLMELDHADYGRLLSLFPVPVLREMCLKFPYFAQAPWVDDPAEFAERVKRIQARTELESLLSSLEEPSAEELRDIVTVLRSLAPTAKRVLAATAARIQPVGGPDPALSDPVMVRALYDEVWDAVKNGDSTTTAMQRVADRVGVGLKTVQRRLADERNRRASLKHLSDSQVDSRSDPSFENAPKTEDLLE